MSVSFREVIGADPGGLSLVVAAHPDDEVLGAGGWAARHPGTRVAILSEGTTAYYGGGPLASLPRPARDEALDRIRRKRLATRRAAEWLRAVVVREGDLPDQRVTLEAALPLVERWVRELRPAVVITHRSTDLNGDHRAVAEAVAVATRPTTEAGRRARLVLGMHVDVAGWPGMYLGPGADRTLFMEMTEDDMQRKLNALTEYEDEVRPRPHPRSLYGVRATAQWAGVASGADLAEPFELVWGRL